MSKLEAYAEAVKARLIKESDLLNTETHQANAEERSYILFKQLVKVLEPLNMREVLCEYGEKRREIGNASSLSYRLVEQVEELEEEENVARRAWIEELKANV